MKNNYLHQWLTLFPDLEWMLSPKKKNILNGVDPAKYIDHNFTNAREVVAIIRDYEPQAWKWIRRFPALKDLPPEDYVILDHICTHHFQLEVTEADIRRIIEYRKKQEREKKDKDSRYKAKIYYETHKEEIIAEEKERNKMAKSFKNGIIISTAMIYSGAAIARAGHVEAGSGIALLGSLVMICPTIRKINRLKYLDENTVIPKNKPDKSGLGAAATIFVICYYVGLVGMGILLSYPVLWYALGRSATAHALEIGLGLMLVPAIIILIAGFFSRNE